MSKLYARSGLWPLWLGMHPSLVKTEGRVCHLPPFADPDFAYPISEELTIDPQGDIYGHDVVNDWGMGSPVRYARVPIAPLYARDLAGRVIYIGRRPICGDAAWPQGLKALTPDHAVDVELGGMPGSDLLESVFLLQWRLLEPSSDYVYVTSGDAEESSAVLYDRHNLYPYKLRLDTFYGDGWRLPQLQHLHVRRGQDLREAENQGADLLRKWQERPAGQNYTDFMTELGEEAIAAMYQKGCTLVPTLEACNGYNKVSVDYELEDYFPGRAVPELHKIVETRADAAPNGTILEVVQPGYALENRIEPAHVVVSDGSGYKTPHAEAPEALIPDVRLPHQRTGTKWGATWLPTHPSHFEAPAIWGWDDKSGHFVQQGGPLWDPLHYYYASVPKILAAERTGRLRENPALIRVPDDMRLRFYPIVPMQGYDIFDYKQLVDRYEAEDPMLTMLRFHDAGREVCGIGYHPLPLLYEHELDNWWFPELLPQNRSAEEVVPFRYEGRIAEVVQPQVSPIEYKNLLVGDPVAPWVTDQGLLAMPESDTLKNYPQLKRYIGEAADAEILALTPPYLENLPDVVLEAIPDDLWAGYDIFDDIENLSSGLYAELQELRDKSLKLMRLRHRIFRQNRNMYLRAYWEGTSPKVLEKQFFEADSGTQAQKPKLKAAFAAPPVITNE